MSGGTVVVDQIDGFRPVICFETTNELHRRTIESVDILIVIAYRKERELAILILQRASRQGRNQLVLVLTDVLVFVYEYPAETRKKAFTLIVYLLRLQPIAVQ